MFCSNCGNELNNSDKFCSICGQPIDNSAESKKPFIRISDEKPVQEKKDSNIWSVITVISLIGLALIYGPAFMDGISSDSNSVDDASSSSVSLSNSYSSDNTAPSTMSQEEKNAQICEQAAKDYYSTHTYTENDVFDCDNMAQDLWNILETKGINSEIMIGNVDSFGPVTLEDCNHAWVIAEVSSNTWLAIECTGGYVVYDNDLYYRGFSFNNPKNYQRFLDLYGDWEYQYQDYENYREYYNELVEIYNAANYLEQVGMESGMTVARNTLEEKERIFQRTDAELDALLEYG